MANSIDFTKTLLFQERELNGKLENARKMLEKSFTIFQVQDITELSFEQIQKLQDEIDK